jgi:hypothetical protein
MDKHTLSERDICTKFITPALRRAGWVYNARDEVIVRSSNLLICKAAFEKALFVYPSDHLEIRQGARVILKSKEDEPGS